MVSTESLVFLRIRFKASFDRVENRSLEFLAEYASSLNIAAATFLSSQLSFHRVMSNFRFWLELKRSFGISVVNDSFFSLFDSSSCKHSIRVPSSWGSISSRKLIRLSFVFTKNLSAAKLKKITGTYLSFAEHSVGSRSDRLSNMTTGCGMLFRTENIWSDHLTSMSFLE